MTRSTKHLINLAAEWPKYRPFANAYKHGLLVANPADVTLLDDAGAEVDGIVVWQRRRTGAEGYGHIPPPFEEMADYLSRLRTSPSTSSSTWLTRASGYSSSSTCAPTGAGR